MKTLGVAGLVGMVVVTGALARAQDYSTLRINEVIADNKEQPPADVGGSYVDMIEVYNAGTETLTLGTSDDDQSIALTDGVELPQDPAPWRFPSGTTILPGKYLIIFCDGNSEEQGKCELHASFNIASDGTEAITIWGPVIGVEEGKKVRQVIDQVWLPPLDTDVSFGRYPDGAGPAPVPIGEVLTTFNFYPRGTSTFGAECLELPTSPCGTGLKKHVCLGETNASSGANLPPHVNLETHSTNHPSAGEAVKFRARVKDEKVPTPPNIAKVEVVYRVNGGAEQSVQFTYDSQTGVQQGVIPDCDGSLPGTDPCPNPFDLWTFWNGQIPGQPAGSLVEFYLHVVDAQGSDDTSPDVLCPDGMGPCDRDFGGPNCLNDSEDVSCTPPRIGLKFLECRTRFSYKVGYTPRTELASVVVNEVVAQQYRTLQDLTEPPCSESKCPPSDPSCCKFDEDFIELFNNSTTDTVPLAGLWLSDGPFNPEVWQFPAGSKILPLEHLIIWLDKDGGKCPNDSDPDKPCFWECPDPTNPSGQEYHTNFALDHAGDQIYLFDTKENGYGVIHGVEFGPQELNHALTLIPDGSRNGCWIDTAAPTPREANIGSCPGARFRRGDANGSCGIDLSDAVYTLNYLFSGGAPLFCQDAADANDSGKVDLSDAVFTLGYLFLGTGHPPAPGPDVPGVDPTDDDLPDCQPPSC